MDETSHAQTIAYDEARELKRAGERYGIATACAGGGQGVAILIENSDVAA